MDMLSQTADVIQERLEYIYHWLKDGTTFFDEKGHFNHLCHFSDDLGDIVHYLELKASKWCISISSSNESIHITYKDSENDITNSLPYHLWNCDSALENTVRQFKLFEVNNDPEL